VVRIHVRPPPLPARSSSRASADPLGCNHSATEMRVSAWSSSCLAGSDCITAAHRPPGAARLEWQGSTTASAADEGPVTSGAGAQSADRLSILWHREPGRVQLLRKVRHIAGCAASDRRGRHIAGCAASDRRGAQGRHHRPLQSTCAPAAASPRLLSLRHALRRLEPASPSWRSLQRPSGRRSAAVTASWPPAWCDRSRRCCTNRGSRWSGT
jgi:hypothetical protein